MSYNSGSNRARNFKSILKLLARLLPELYSTRSNYYYISLQLVIKLNKSKESVSPLALQWGNTFFLPLTVSNSCWVCLCKEDSICSTFWKLPRSLILSKCNIFQAQIPRDLLLSEVEKQNSHNELLRQNLKTVRKIKGCRHVTKTKYTHKRVLTTTSVTTMILFF